MGHGEMLWELGGLPPARIAAVGRVRAGGDWSSFPVPEQQALAFARQLTKAPWSIRANDVESLTHDLVSTAPPPSSGGNAAAIT